MRNLASRLDLLPRIRAQRCQRQGLICLVSSEVLHLFYIGFCQWTIPPLGIIHVRLRSNTGFGITKKQNTKPFHIFLQPKVESTHSLKDSLEMLAKVYFWRRGLRRDVTRNWCTERLDVRQHCDRYVEIDVCSIFKPLLKVHQLALQFCNCSTPCNSPRQHEKCTTCVFMTSQCVVESQNFVNHFLMLTTKDTIHQRYAYINAVSCA